jgi:AcrR family transcriptional regulator
LISESGYEALTIDSIASAAGVGRQTIYRWWSSKSSIIAEALIDGALVGLDAPATDATAESLLEAWFAALRDAANSAIVRALAAAAASESADSEALYEHFTRGSHAALEGAIRRGQEDRTIRLDIDSATTADALIGALLYHVLTRIEVSEGYAAQLLRAYKTM